MYDCKIVCGNETTCQLIICYLKRYLNKNIEWQEKCTYQIRKNVLYIHTNGFERVINYCKRFDCPLSQVSFNYMNRWYRIKK